MSKFPRGFGSKLRKHHLHWAKRDAACSNFYQLWEADRELRHVWVSAPTPPCKIQNPVIYYFYFFLFFSYSTQLTLLTVFLTHSNKMGGGEELVVSSRKIVAEKVAKWPHVAFPLKRRATPNLPPQHSATEMLPESYAVFQNGKKKKYWSEFLKVNYQVTTRKNKGWKANSC